MGLSSVALGWLCVQGTGSYQDHTGGPCLRYRLPDAWTVHQISPHFTFNFQPSHHSPQFVVKGPCCPVLQCKMWKEHHQIQSFIMFQVMSLWMFFSGSDIETSSGDLKTYSKVLGSVVWRWALEVRSRGDCKASVDTGQSRIISQLFKRRNM